MDLSKPTIRSIMGKHIQALRKQKGMNQEELSFTCNIDRSFLSLIEQGHHEPSVTKIFDLCKGLDIKPSYFFRLVEEDYGKLFQNQLSDDKNLS